MKADEAKRGFYALGEGLKRCHTETEWLFENGIDASKPTTFVARNRTFVARNQTFVARNRTFVAKKQTFVAKKQTFVGRKVDFCGSKSRLLWVEKDAFLDEKRLF
ncbi:MAG: hypothetical protein ACK551_02025 [Vampirovibrionales bacterium]